MTKRRGVISSVVIIMATDTGTFIITIGIILDMLMLFSYGRACFHSCHW